MPVFLFSANVIADVTNIYLDEDIIRSASGSNPSFGKFYGYRTLEEGPGDDAFAKCLEMARTRNVPLVVICTQDDCSHCSGFNDNMNKDKEMLLEWMATRSVVFAYFKCSSSPYSRIPYASYEALNFLGNKCRLDTTKAGIVTPYFGVYYQTPSGTENYIAGSFARNTWTVGSYAATTVSDMILALDTQFSYLAPERYIRDADPEPEGGDATFACGASGGARLESMPSTETVHVPLLRNRNLSVAATNTLEVVYPDSTTASLDVIWPASAGTEQTQEVAVSVQDCNDAGDTVLLRLWDAAGTLMATNAIACVAEEANRQRFPYWIGERTEATLNWGEWTFDLDVATNKVRMAAAAGTNAWTLAVVGGTLWCPNCAQCEATLFDQPRFKEWAQANHVALALLDQPAKGADGPTLLTHTPSADGTKSGSYYLSRKGLTIAEGRALFDKIHALSWTRAPEGWLVEPTADRIANPTLILIRPNGSIAGRLTVCRKKGDGIALSNEAFDLEENIARLTELFSLGADEDEERNNKPAYTRLNFKYGDTNSCSLQVSDRADVFRFDGLRAGEMFRIASSTSAGAKSTPTFALLTVTNATTGAYSRIESLGEGEAMWRLTQSQIDAGIYLEVGAYSTQQESRYGTYGGKSSFTTTFWTEVVPPDPGVVGFEVDSVEVTERLGTLVLSVVRSRGSSGPVRARIDLDQAATTAAADSYVWDEGDAAGHTLEWGDFEFGAKKISVPLVNDTEWTGNRQLAFTLSPLGDSGVEAGVTNFVATILEDEVVSAGMLEIAATSPAAAKGTVVDVPAGGVLALAVRRSVASFGEASAHFTVSCPAVRISSETLTWEDRETGIKTVTFTLPDATAFGENPVFTIEMTVSKEVTTSAARSRVTVRVVDEDRAFFVQDAKDICVESVQGCAFTKSFALSDPSRFTQSARVVAVSGELPRGLEAKWDAEKGVLTVSGAVRQSGDHDVTLRLEGKSADGAETSLPVQLSISAPPLSSFSPLLAVAHDFRDMPVVTTGADGVRAMVGTLDLSIPLSGRLSARYRRSNGSVAIFSFEGWTGVDAHCVYAEKTVRYMPQEVCCGLLVDASMEAECSLLVATSADGTFDVQLIDDEYDASIEVTAQKSAPWSFADPAEAWIGTYTAAHTPIDIAAMHSPAAPCAGAPTLSFRMSPGAAMSGRIAYSGMLPSGKTFSGSARLVRDEAESGDGIRSALLPVLYADWRDTFSSLLRVFNSLRRVEGEDVRYMSVVRDDASAVPFWRHERKYDAYSEEPLSQQIWYSAHGSWLDPDQDWGQLLHDHYLSTSLPLLIWSGDAVGRAADVIAQNSTNLAVTAGGEDVRFEFNRSTGQFRGTFKDADTGENVRYFGVVTPGWLGDCGCGGDGGEEYTARPFAAGAWWRTVQGEYQDEIAEWTMQTAVVGDLVSIGDVDEE